MTTNPSSKASSVAPGQSPFRVVPPEQIAESAAPTAAQPAAPPAAQPKSPTVQPGASPEERPLVSKSQRKWLMAGAIVLGLVGLGFIPITNYVTGETRITSTLKSRQLVTMPVAGTVRIPVDANDEVQPGDLVLQIYSDELDNQLAEATITLEQQKAALREAEKQLQLAQNRHREARAAAAISQQRAAQLNADMRGISQGTPPPLIQQLHQELRGLTTRFAKQKEQLARYQSIVTEGAIALDALTRLEIAIAETEMLIHSKREQIAAATKRVTEESAQQNADAFRMETGINSAAEQISAAQTAVANQKLLVKSQALKWQQLAAQKQRLTVTATTAGIVVTPDLGQLDGRYLPSGAEVMEIADLEQLTAKVQVLQEDASLIQRGDSVSFHARGDDTRPYNAEVKSKDIAAIVQANETRPRPTLQVNILIDNDEDRLRPGVQGYAHINTGKMRLYQKLRHEFLKLVPISKWKFF